MKIPEKHERLIPIETVQKLTDRAHRLLIENLENYGNQIAKPHSDALFQIVASFSSIAGRIRPAAREAFPLFAGGGKTQSIVAWLSTATGMRLLGSPLSIAVSASRVEALCDLKRDLIQHGVPKDQIGLIHSYKYNLQRAKAYIENDTDLPYEHASEPATDDNENRPILLLTHNKIQGKKHMNEYYQYKGNGRSLLIWDESLIKAESQSLSLKYLLSGLGYRRPHLNMNHPLHKEALKYIENTIEAFKKIAEEEHPITLRLPPLPPEKIMAFKELFHGPIEIAIRKLLEVSKADLRVIGKGDQNTSIIQYTIVVPPELKNVVVLDASYKIRELCRLDSTISQPPYFPQDLASYEKVTMNHIRHPAGRESLTKKLNDGNRELIREFVEIVKGIPTNEAILFFTFLPRIGKDEVTGIKGVDFREILEKAFASEDIDINAMVETTEGEKPRMCWLTHGSETSLSKFSYCSNVIWYGVLHRGEAEMASKIAGQTEDYLTDLSPSRVRSVINSEVDYRFHQGTARGSCRVVNNGIAERQNVWLLYPNDSIRQPLNSVMPNLNWIDYKPKHLTKPKQNSQEMIAKKIETVISQYLEDNLKVVDNFELLKISTRKLKQILNFNDIPPNRTFTRAIHLFIDNSQHWAYEGRSLIYKSAAYYGFTIEDGFTIET